MYQATKFIKKLLHTKHYGGYYKGYIKRKVLGKKKRKKKRTKYILGKGVNKKMIKKVKIIFALPAAL